MSSIFIRKMTRTRFGSSSGGAGERGPRGFPGVGIEDITFDDNNDGSVTITIDMTDGTTYGPFTGTLVSDNVIALNKLTLEGTDKTDKFQILRNDESVMFNVDTSTDGGKVKIDINKNSIGTPLTLRNSHSSGHTSLRFESKGAEAFGGGTAQIIYNSGGGFWVLMANSGANRYFAPYETDTYTLGTSTYRWGGLYSKVGDFTGDVVVGSTNSTTKFQVKKNDGNALLCADTTNGQFVVKDNENDDLFTASKDFSVVIIGGEEKGAKFSVRNADDVPIFVCDTLTDYVHINNRLQMTDGTYIYADSFSAKGDIFFTALTESSLLQLDGSRKVTASNSLPSGCAATNMTLTTPTVTSMVSGSGIGSGGGSAATPAYGFTNTTNTGIYSSANNEIAFASGNGKRMWISTSNVYFAANINAEQTSPRDIGTSTAKFQNIYLSDGIHLNNGSSGTFYNNIYALKTGTGYGRGIVMSYNTDFGTTLGSVGTPVVGTVRGSSIGGYYEIHAGSTSSDCRHTWALSDPATKTIGDSVSMRMGLYYTELRPASTNVMNLGSASNAWKDIWTGATPTNLSDFNLKKDISTSDLGLDFVDQLRPVKYRFIDGTSNRFHYGLIAQEVEQVLIDNEIPTSDFAGFVKETMTESTVDEEGNETVTPIGDRYALRYSEFISITMKAIQELKAIVEGQAEQISALQCQLNDLLNN